MQKLEFLRPIHPQEIKTQVIPFAVEEKIICDLNRLTEAALKAGYTLDPTDKINECLRSFCIQAEHEIMEINLIERPDAEIGA